MKLIDAVMLMIEGKQLYHPDLDGFIYYDSKLTKYIQETKERKQVIKMMSQPSTGYELRG